MLNRKLAIRIIVLSALSLSLIQANPAIAESEDGGGDNKQTPVQVIAEIVITAIAMKWLDAWIVKL